VRRFSIVFLNYQRYRILGRPQRSEILLSLQLLLVLVLLGIAGCANIGTTSTKGGPARPLPHFNHIVIVVEENHSYTDITSTTDAPYLASLSQQGAAFTDAHAITHPSQPNYLALFAGSTFGVTSDACPLQLTGPNLASELIAHGLRFTGFSESMPETGYTGCDDGTADQLYARKHNPWVNFVNVPAPSNQPFRYFPTDFNQLPNVAFVVPNQVHDMHSGSVAEADAWLRQSIGSYAQWAPAHNSLLVVTWDEDDGSEANHILTLFVGAHVQAGEYPETVNHYDTLRTVEALEGLPFTNEAAHATTIADIWLR
jgi:acid phosphatase